MLKVKMTCLAASLALHLENRWTLISASFLIINNSYVLTSYICTVFCEYVRILLQQVLLKSFKCDPSPLQLRARQMLSHQKPNRRKTWTQYITPCHPDVSSTSVRVREKGNTDKSLKPANEISQGHQKWSGRWGSFQSGRISFGLYCLAQTLQGEVKQPQHVKASKTAFFFLPLCTFWLHPTPLTNMLLNGPFSMRTLKVQGVAVIAPRTSLQYCGIELCLTFVGNNGWRPFIFLAFTVLRGRTSLHCVFLRCVSNSQAG